MNYPWIGKADQIDDYDLPRIGHEIGVGEDIVHMILDVESRGEGFDENGVIKLYEEHVFYKYVAPDKRDEAIRIGVAHPRWRKNYKNNHARFLKAYELDPQAALTSCSWGLGQIMGFNHSLVGYKTPLQMVKAFAADEANQLEAMITFIKSKKIDDELREMEKTNDRKKLVELARTVAYYYNGSGYEKNDYHNRLVDRLLWWRKKPDTPWSPKMAKEEDKQAEKKIETPKSNRLIDIIIRIFERIFNR